MLGILAGMDQEDSYVARFWRTWCLWFRLPKTVDFPQLQSIKVVDISFVVHRPIPMVLLTIETPQLRMDTVVDVPLLQVVQSFFPSCRQAWMLGILAGMDQIDSYVICLWFRLPKTVDFPQLQSIKVVDSFSRCTG